MLGSVVSCKGVEVCKGGQDTVRGRVGSVDQKINKKKIYDLIKPVKISKHITYLNIPYMRRHKP